MAMNVRHDIIAASKSCASRLIFYIKLNNNPDLPKNAGTLCCARASGHNA
jgi:hypothetical protein